MDIRIELTSMPGAKVPFTPLESPSIPACPALGRDRGRQTSMLGMVEIESISSLFLPTGRQGGRRQSLALSNGVRRTI